MSPQPAVTPEATPRRSRGRQRALPERNDRSAITLFISKALDTKLDLFAGLNHRAKNEIFAELLSEFLSRRPISRADSEGCFCPLGSEERVRVTFIVPRQLQRKLGDCFGRGDRTSAIRLAITEFLGSHSITPRPDVREWLMQKLLSSEY